MPVVPIAAHARGPISSRPQPTPGPQGQRGRGSVGDQSADRYPGQAQLYDRYHAYQAAARGWPEHPAKDAAGYANSFVDNPFPTQEWCYYLNDRLVGVGYVDDLPDGLSAIYFFYDPDERQRSLGTWNVLNMIEHARRRGIPYVYLGYYVAGCPSMIYKRRSCPTRCWATTGSGLMSRHNCLPFRPRGTEGPRKRPLHLPRQIFTVSPKLAPKRIDFRNHANAAARGCVEASGKLLFRDEVAAYGPGPNCRNPQADQNLPRFLGPQKKAPSTRST